MAATTLVEMFLDVVQQFGSKTSLMNKVEGQYQGIAYQEFGERVKNLALGLASLGVVKGDRVALLTENRPEWAISDLGILSLGAVNVPIYPTLTAEQMEYILRDSAAKLVIVSQPELLSKIFGIFDGLEGLEKIVSTEEIAEKQEYILKFHEVLELGKAFGQKNPDYYEKATHQVKADDLCGLVYTSGTTGVPKGVMLSHNNILSNVVVCRQILDVNVNDVWLSFLPLCHAFERMAGHFTAIASGSTIAYAESIDTVAQNLQEVRPTIMTSVPRLFEKMYARVVESVEAGPGLKKKIFYWSLKVGEKYNKAKEEGEIPGGLKFKYGLANKLVFSKLKERVGGRLRFFVSGGAPLSKEIGDFFNNAGLIILEGYGLTETSPVIAVNRLENYKFGTVGPAIPGVEIKIADDGEILTRGPHVMKGYYHMPEASKEILESDGWLHTGDVGYLDEDGFLVITDRKKNILVTSGGKNVPPQPIENLLLTSPYIEQVMLIGDKRHFISALIVPKFDNLKAYAAKEGIAYTDVRELVSHEQIYHLVENEIERLSTDLASFERIKKFTLMEKPFTVEENELTPTLKIKRHVVLKKYADVIERMYQ